MFWFRDCHIILKINIEWTIDGILWKRFRKVPISDFSTIRLVGKRFSSARPSSGTVMESFVSEKSVGAVSLTVAERFVAATHTIKANIIATAFFMLHLHEKPGLVHGMKQDPVVKNPYVKPGRLEFRMPEATAGEGFGTAMVPGYSRGHGFNLKKRVHTRLKARNMPLSVLLAEYKLVFLIHRAEPWAFANGLRARAAVIIPLLCWIRVFQQTWPPSSTELS